jgi:hypothetical protein
MWSELRDYCSDDGFLTIDFLVGFGIFIVAFIMVVSIVPGLFVGINGAGIDYDAVAYRTSVILMEDPGSPSDPGWEYLAVSNKDDIERFGLSLSSESPAVLSEKKVIEFFNQGNFEFTEDDYRDLAVFGEIEYNYNISLKIKDGAAYYIGSPVPEMGYGYMRRLGLIRIDPAAEINCEEYNTGTAERNLTSVDTDITLSLNYSELINAEIPVEYRINPLSESVLFEISNFSASLNKSYISSAKITKIRYYKSGAYVPRNYDRFDNTSYRFDVDGVYYTMGSDSSADDINVTDSDTVRFMLLPPTMFSSQADAVFQVVINLTYEFDNNLYDHNYTSGDFDYGYGRDYMAEPYLVPVVMEVAVW